jgi:hypothetical protein
MKRFALAALLAFALSACVSLPNPIGSSVGFKNDPALEGLWYGKTDKDEKRAAYYHVLLNADNTATAVGVSAGHSDDKGGWAVLAVTTATLGPNHYINGQELFEDGKPKDDKTVYSGYYTVTGDTLTIYALDDRKVAAEIRAHHIDGTVTPGRFGDNIAITADAAHVDKWLSSPGAPKLFAPLLTLHRVKEPG